MIALVFVIFSFRLFQSSKNETIKYLPANYFEVLEEAVYLIYQNLGIESLWQFPFFGSQEFREDPTFINISAAFNFPPSDNRAIFLYYAFAISLLNRNHLPLEKNHNFLESGPYKLPFLIGTLATIANFDPKCLLLETNDATSYGLQSILTSAQPYLIQECERGNYSLITIFYNCWKKILG